MSTEYRGDGKYRFRVTKDGIPYTKNFECDKKIGEKDIKEKKWPKEVRAAHKKFEVDVSQGRFGNNENMKFSELAQLVMDEHVRPNTRKHTISAYLNDFNNHLLKEFGNTPVSKIKKINVVQFKNKLLKKHEEATVKRIISTASTTFNKGIEWELITSNPFAKIKYGTKKTNKNKEILSQKDIVTLLDAIYQEPHKTFRMIFLTAFGTGYREGEILGLTVPVVNLKEGSIDVQNQYAWYIEDGKMHHETSDVKTPNSERKTYIPDFLVSELRSYIKDMKVTDTEQHLFVNPNTGKVYTHNAVWYNFNKLLKRSGLDENLSIHKLRHLKGTMLAASETDITSLARQLGDTIQTVSQVYLHPMNIAEKESVKKYEDYLTKLERGVSENVQ